MFSAPFASQQPDWIFCLFPGDSTLADQRRQKTTSVHIIVFFWVSGRRAKSNSLQRSFSTQERVVIFQS